MPQVITSGASAAGTFLVTSTDSFQGMLSQRAVRQEPDRQEGLRSAQSHRAVHLSRRRRSGSVGLRSIVACWGAAGVAGATLGGPRGATAPCTRPRRACRRCIARNPSLDHVLTRCLPPLVLSSLDNMERGTAGSCRHLVVLCLLKQGS